jgi:hypothetical protein
MLVIHDKAMAVAAVPDGRIFGGISQLLYS